MSLPSGLLGISSHLCMPAAGVLAAALAGVACRRRLRTSAHGGTLAAHLITLLAWELMQTAYIASVLNCDVVVPLGSFITLSSACWLQCICFNMVYRLRNSSRERFIEKFVCFFVSMLYSWLTPYIIVLLVNTLLQRVLKDIAVFQDTKTCFHIEGLINKYGEIDESIYFLIARGLLILVSACTFTYLVYKIGRQKRGILLCVQDAGNMADIMKRQRQAIRYVLLFVGTFAMETIADLGVWYTKHNQSHIRPKSPNPDLLAAERIFKSFSFCVDFFRCVLICDIIWSGGPKCRTTEEQSAQAENQPRRESVESLPGYEEAIRQPALTRSVLSPPSYVSLFGGNNRICSRNGNCIDNTESVDESDVATNVNDLLYEADDERDESIANDVSQVDLEGNGDVLVAIEVQCSA